MYGDNIDTKNITSDDSKNLIKDKLLDQYNISIKYGYNGGGLHEYENLINEHEQQETQFWNNSRLNSGLDNIKRMTKDRASNVKERFENIFNFNSGNINTNNPEGKESSGLFKGLKKNSEELKKKFVKERIYL